MQSIIGLLDSTTPVESAVRKIKEAGISEDRIRVLSNPQSINKLFGCDPLCMVGNYAIVGAAISAGIYAIFGLAAAMCQCNLMHYGQGYGIGTLLGALLAGTFVGGVIGMLVGMDEAEKNSHLYVQGARLGGKVIAIQLSEDDIERVKIILVNENALGVKLVEPEQA
jgi:hypothetical protein